MAKSFYLLVTNCMALAVLLFVSASSARPHRVRWYDDIEMVIAGPAPARGPPVVMTADKRLRRIPTTKIRNLNPGYTFVRGPHETPFISNANFDNREMDRETDLKSRVFRGNGVYAFNPFLRYLERSNANAERWRPQQVVEQVVDPALRKLYCEHYPGDEICP